MVELSERLRLPQEPGTGGVVAEEIDADADPALQRHVVRLEQHAVGVRGHDALEPIAGAERGGGALEGEDRIGRRSPARAPTPLDRSCRPQTSASHQRRLPVGESSVRNREQDSAAQRRIATRGSASVVAAERAMASSAPGARKGANWSRQSPLTRVSCWRPAPMPSCWFRAAIDTARRAPAVVQRFGELGQPGAELEDLSQRHGLTGMVEAAAARTSGSRRRHREGGRAGKRCVHGRC